MSELELIKEELVNEGLSGSEIEKILQILKEVYIGQNIRSEGILASHFANVNDQIKILKERELIKVNRWYLTQYLTTERGSKIAKELLLYELEAIGDKLRHIFDEIPENLLRFLLSEHFSKRLVFPTKPHEYIFEWEDVVLRDSRVTIARNKILNRLEKFGFCVRTNYYVSTGGGKLKDLYYVISPEIQEKLLSINPELLSPDEWVRKNCMVYFFLANKVSSSLRVSETGRSEGDISVVRQKFWNYLESMSLTEEDIKPIVDEMSRKGITSEYRGLFAMDLPFEIIDEVGYQIYLKEAIVKPVLSYLFGEVDKPEIKTTKPKSKIIEKDEKLPPDIVPIREQIEFFWELGDFEKQVREFIASKLGKNLQKCKNDKLLEKLKERKKKKNF